MEFSKRIKRSYLGRVEDDLDGVHSVDNLTDKCWCGGSLRITNHVIY